MIYFIKEEKKINTLDKSFKDIISNISDLKEDKKINLYFDMTNKILGRAAGYIVKLIRKNYYKINKIYFINIKDMIITGNKKNIIDTYKNYSLLGRFKHKKIFHKSIPYIFMKAIKGMIRRDNKKYVLSKIRIFNELRQWMPNTFINIKDIKDINDLKLGKFMYLKDLIKKL